MFRTQKNDETIEHRDPEADTADQGSSPSGSGGSVTSSALRWLSGSHQYGEATATPRRRLAGSEFPVKTDLAEIGDLVEMDDLADELELTDELELSDPVGIDAPIELHDVQRLDKDGGRIPLAMSEASEAPKLLPAKHEDYVSLFEFDDNDDIGDFDELGDLSDTLPPASAERVSLAPKVELDDLSSLDDDIQPTAPVEESFAPSPAWPKDVERQPARSEQTVVEPETETEEIAAIAKPAAPASPPLVQTAASEDLPKVVLRKPALEQHVPSDGSAETPHKSGPAGLALQPIPELQTELRRARQSPAASETERGKTEALIAADADPIDDVDGSSPVLAEEADEPGTSDVTSDLAAIAALEADEWDNDDNAVVEDWHTHLADALGGTDKSGELEPADIDFAARTDSQNIEPPSVLPLSATLARLANESEPDLDAEKDDPARPFPAPTQRQTAEISQLPPTAMDVDRTELSPEQLALGIVTNVPRLRRFAAVQIGDEAEADRLVQTTIVQALADPSVLQAAQDSGQALLMLLYRGRQQNLNGAAAVRHTTETALTPETTLCHGLTGADQFEIHQFARAMNQIPEQDRALLVLSALESLNYEQIAGMAQLPLDQIVVKLADARLHLRQALTTDGTGHASETNVAHPRETEIHGYLDGELDARHMADMDSLVEHDQDAADRLMHYGIQGDLIRRIYAPLLNRPIPQDMLEALSTTMKKPANPKRGFFPGARRALFAGAIAIALSAGAATWFEMVPSLKGIISEATSISSLATKGASITDRRDRIASAFPL